MKYARKYASAHERGTRKTEAQKDIAATARVRGYSKLKVYALASLIRRDLMSTKEAKLILHEYRLKLDL
jgi:hypothetical protein